MSSSTICAFAPDKRSLWRFMRGAWTKIGNENIGRVYGGGLGLFATLYEGYDSEYERGSLLHHFQGDDGTDYGWEWVGSPGGTFAVTKTSVFGITPSFDAVYRYHGNVWTRVGDAAGWLYGGVHGLLATDPDTYHVFRFKGVSDWEHIGGPGANFVVTADAFYGLTPDRKRVYKYTGSGETWTQIGEDASEIYGGEWGLVATSPFDHNLWHYREASNDWEAIGGPGAQFAVTRDTVFGLTPDKQGVYRYDGTPFAWTYVGGPAHSIYAYEDPQS